MRRSQSGFTLLEVLVVGSLLLVFAAGITRLVGGGRASADATRGVALATGQIPDALGRFFYDNGRTYAGISTGWKPTMTSRYRIPLDMPWGGAWTIEAVSPGGDPTAIRIRFPCVQHRLGCQDFLEGIQARDVAGDLISAVVGVGTPTTSIDVTYSRPRT